MENAINVSVSPLQLLLSLGFQIWLVVFPILILRKVNYLTNAVQSLLEEKSSSSDSSD